MHSPNPNGRAGSGDPDFSNELPQPSGDLDAEESTVFDQLALQMPSKHRSKLGIVVLLTELARDIVTLNHMHTEIRATGLIVAGSKGQARVHPLLKEQSNLQNRVSRLLNTLRLTPQEQTPTRLKDLETQDVINQTRQQDAHGLLTILPPAKPN